MELNDCIVKILCLTGDEVVEQEDGEGVVRPVRRAVAARNNARVGLRNRLGQRQAQPSDGESVNGWCLQLIRKDWLIT